MTDQRQPLAAVSHLSNTKVPHNRYEELQNELSEANKKIRKLETVNDAMTSMCLLNMTAAVTTRRVCKEMGNQLSAEKKLSKSLTQNVADLQLFTEGGQVLILQPPGAPLANMDVSEATYRKKLDAARRLAHSVDYQAKAQQAITAAATAANNTKAMANVCNALSVRYLKEELPAEEANSLTDDVKEMLASNSTEVHTQWTAILTRHAKALKEQQTRVAKVANPTPPHLRINEEVPMPMETPSEAPVQRS